MLSIFVLRIYEMHVLTTSEVLSMMKIFYILNKPYSTYYEYFGRLSTGLSKSE